MTSLEFTGKWSYIHENLKNFCGSIQMYRMYRLGRTILWKGEGWVEGESKGGGRCTVSTASFHSCAVVVSGTESKQWRSSTTSAAILFATWPLMKGRSGSVLKNDWKCIQLCSFTVINMFKLHLLKYNQNFGRTCNSKQTVFVIREVINRQSSSILWCSLRFMSCL